MASCGELAKQISDMARTSQNTRFESCCRPPPQVINGCTGGRMLALLNQISEALLIPNATLGQNSLFCIRFLTVRSACAQPAHNLSPEPFSQTSSQASFQGQGGERSTRGEKSGVLNLKREARLSPNAILVQNRVFYIGFFKFPGACAQPAHNLSRRLFSQTS